MRKKVKIAVFIPTYNEAQNIEEVINSIIKNIGNGGEIIVVDDNSPDKTWKIVENVCGKRENVHLIRRTTERGRGTAGLSGFSECLEFNPDYVVEMDGDNSHDAQEIKKLVDEIKSYDVVLGSRFVKGGSDIERGFGRKTLTKFARFYLKSVLGINVQDPTSGFKVYRSDVLRNIMKKLKSKDHFITIEILYYLKKGGFKIKESPISFRERRYGKSKLNLTTVVKILFKSLKLRISGYSGL